MSEKELLYVEDALSHLEYFKKHLEINTDCLTDSKNISALKKMSKKACNLYKELYELLEGAI